MSITLLTGATASQTGGSGLTFTLKNQNAQGSTVYICETDTNPTTRRTLALSAKNAGLPANTDSFATMGKNRSVLTTPEIGADGKMYFRRVITEVIYTPWASTATIDADVQLLQSLAVDSELNKARTQGITNVG